MLAAASTFLGGCLVVAARRWSIANRDYLLAFAAGVLIGLSFLEIIPEALTVHADAPYFLVAGFFFMFVVEQLAIPHHGHQHDLHAHDDEPETADSMGILAWAGVLIHSFVDGLAISSGAAVDVGLAQSVTAGVIMHELPEGLLAASLLLTHGSSSARALLLTTLVALATPAGAVLSDLALQWMERGALESVSTMAVALAAGTFVYVGAADMLHHAHGRPIRAVTAFSIGLGIFVLKRVFFGH
jgi:zinc transporter ZupT